MTLKQSVQGASLLVLLAVAGCSVNASVTADSCSPDSNVAGCASGTDGWSCSGALTPDTSTLSCSGGTPGAGTNGDTGFCCVAFAPASGTCAADATVSGCAGGSFGFSCASTDTPDQTDATLVCSTGVAGNAGSTLFCCTDGTTTVVPTTTCAADATVNCSAGGNGFSCTGSDMPDTSSLICSDGTAGAGMGGATGFCCIPAATTTTTCAEDATVTGCVAGSFGFSCTGSDAPQAAYTNLTCSTATAGNAGSSLYCCTD